MVASITGRFLVNNYDTFLFDADGVLWQGELTLPGAVELTEKLKEKGKEVFIVSNNSTRTLSEYKAKCDRRGFSSIEEDHIITPARLMSQFLIQSGSNLPVYMIATKGLQRSLEHAGIHCIGVGPDNASDYTKDNHIFNIDITQPVQAVIVGFDIFISYPKMMKAANYLKNPDVKFIATSEDCFFPDAKEGCHIPAAGGNVASIRLLTGREPTVVGKPARPMLDYIKKYYRLSPETTIVIGDNCHTDIKFGNSNGLKTLLVETGVTTEEKLKEFVNAANLDIVPDFFSPSLSDLLNTF
ncbi:hypothetical protein AB6A40_000057 [Gnathostoma spinigerum]|uniref:Phosphoglycolate phosphatase n=1 Tax=Gnathostoma spinigerum TaxID=75299 RepID=A0ABD6E9G8_9BILA